MAIAVFLTCRTWLPSKSAWSKVGWLSNGSIWVSFLGAHEVGAHEAISPDAQTAVSLHWEVVLLTLLVRDLSSSRRRPSGRFFHGYERRTQGKRSRVAGAKGSSHRRGDGILTAAAIPRLPYYAQRLMGHRLPFRIDRSFRRYQRRLLSVPYAPLQLPNF